MTLYGLERVRTGAIRHREIEPQGFVARYQMSASAQVAVSISYVHAGTKVLHFAQLLEVHRVLGVREDLVHFILQVLIADWIEQQVVEDGGQCGLDRVSACNDGKCAIGEHIRDRGPVPFLLAIITLGHDLSVIKKDWRDGQRTLTRW